MAAPPRAQSPPALAGRGSRRAEPGSAMACRPRNGRTLEFPSATSFCQLDRQFQRGQLPQALFVLGRRIGVGDDAGAGLEEREARSEERRVGKEWRSGWAADEE